MRIEDGGRAGEIPRIVEGDRLRQLDDRAVGKALHDVLPEVLMRGPEIAEIPAPAQQDDAAADGRAQRLGREGGDVAAVGDGRPGRLQPRLLREPDRAVPHVRLIREVEERTGPVALEEGPEDVVDAALQLGDQQVGAHQRGASTTAGPCSPRSRGSGRSSRGPAALGHPR